MKRWLAVTFSLIFFSLSARAQTPSAAGNPTREFIMSCTYGVMAGTLVGAASLAFTNKPSDNLNRVARGASIGLYTGILLGLYVVYIVPGMMEEDIPEEDPLARLPFLLTPTFADRGPGHEPQIDGLKADWTILRF
ncbi:MAG: hypothetical protein AB7G93_18925 [Bdellovibrionales bacterium]